jgi:hypothetical protein
MGVNMEKLKNAIILSVEILIVIAIILFVTIYIGASGTENNYMKALSLLNSNNYKEASKIVEQIPHYKDASEMYMYIYPNSLYYGSYKSVNETLMNYNKALVYINLMKGKLKTPKYKKSFNELQVAINFKIGEINAEKQNDGISTEINNIGNLIKTGDYLGAGTKLNAIVNPSYDYIKTELNAYIAFLNAVNLNNKKAVNESIKNLDPNYKSILSADISSAVMANVDIVQWASLYNSNKNKNINTEAQNLIITIDSKKADLLSLLGNPIKDEIISNKYGDFEIMTYNNNRTLYLENSILKAFNQ